MARQFDLIVFDWDGTLMDSAAAIVQAIQSACRDLDVAPPTAEAARHVIGLGLEDALRTAVPGLDARRYPEMSARYRHHYLAQDQDLQLFAGAREMLASLAAEGYMLAVATGKSRLGLKRALATSQLAGHFQATRCADECHSKPHPQMLLELMDEFAVMPEQALMIGDTTHDLQMAKNAGVAALAVSYGAHTQTVLEAEMPLWCAPTVAELNAWLREHA